MVLDGPNVDSKVPKAARRASQMVWDTDLGTDFAVFDIFMFFKPQKPEGIHLWK